MAEILSSVCRRKAQEQRWQYYQVTNQRSNDCHTGNLAEQANRRHLTNIIAEKPPTRITLVTTITIPTVRSARPIDSRTSKPENCS